MENKIINKLVIASEPGYGQEFHLLQGRTTIGSAPDNDLQLDYPDVSGFHAEFRIENNTFFISDFNSKKGTFVNEKRITKEKKVAAGDRIQIGSTQTLFLPHNAIVAKKSKFNVNIHKGFKSSNSLKQKWISEKKVNMQEVLEIVKPYYKKLITRNNRKILAYVLPMIALIMLALVIYKNGNEDQGKSTAQHDEVVRSTNMSNGGNGADKKTINSAQNSAGKNENGSPHQIQKRTVGASVGTQQNSSGQSQQDHFDSIYSSIANKFADQQLWHIALEYYHRVFEKNPDNPELSAQIAKMKSEIQNQKIYEGGQALMKEERYEQGIANLRHIPENSFYFLKAAQAISEVKEKIAQASLKD